jgi:hypothetical protein
MGRNLQAPGTLVLSDQAVGFSKFQAVAGMFHNLSTGLVATDALKNHLAHENFCRETIATLGTSIHRPMRMFTPRLHPAQLHPLATQIG